MPNFQCFLRKEGDSNPRFPLGNTRFPGVPLQPLEHLSSFGVQNYHFLFEKPHIRLLFTFL